MDQFDDDLQRFAADGAAPLPDAHHQGSIKHQGAQIWYSVYGAGRPVMLLHGGMGHSGNWGYQVPALLDAGYQVVLIDTRGHGRSTRTAEPYTYELLASDALAVMDTLALKRASLVGWSDGAVVALIMAMQAPERVEKVFFFGCAMDPSGLKPITHMTPEMQRCMGRHVLDYTALSATPDQFEAFASAVNVMMETQPNYTAPQLAQISTPVAIVQSEHDEFIKDTHAAYLADTIPHAQLIELAAVSHFAPLQRPDAFNTTLLNFLEA